MSVKDEKTLDDYQKSVKKLVIELGFDKETVPELFMLLTEEVGEFAKAARKNSGIKTDINSKEHNVEEEAADVLWLMLNLCNKLNIKLDKAFTDKVAKNMSRQWS